MGVLSFSELPVDWVTATIGVVVTVKGGKRLPKGEKLSLIPTAHPYIRVTDFSGFSVNAAGIQYITDNIYKKISRYTISSNDVYISIAGSIGIVGMVPDVLDGANLTENAAKLMVSLGNDLIPQFLMYWLSSDLSQREISAQKVQNAQPKLALARIKSLSLPIPPLPEQRRIAAVLSLVQRAIEEQERLIALTTELKKALMHKLFTEGTREPQKQTEVGPIPESWEVVELGEACIVQTGIAKGRKIDSNNAVTLPYLRVANVQDGYLDLSEMKEIILKKTEIERYSLKEGDVVLTEGGDLDKLGRGFVWHGQIYCCVHQNHIFAVRPKTSLLSSEFLAYQVQSPYGKAYFLSVAHKTTNLACINTSKLKGFPLLVPPKEEQQDIVNTLSILDKKATLYTQKLDVRKDLFRTLLHQLMTAEIRVNDLELDNLE